MKPSMLSRTVATLRAAMWLNSLSDALYSGVLCINPGLSQERATEIARELASFRGHLPRIRSELDMPAEVYATVHLRQWKDDVISNATEDAYPFTQLLKEQKRFRAGRDALRRAKELVESSKLADDENEVIRFSLNLAEGCLLPASSNTQGIEPGVVGEHLRDCDEALEVALTGLHLLRKNDYSQEAADNLVETCRELAVRASKLADHLRNEGLV